jgi:hypothetical protein
MKRLIPTLLIAAASLLALGAFGANRAAAQKGEPLPISISFRNDTKTTVLLQGASVVKGVQRRGQPILIREGKSAFDNNVPVGIRLITIVDANQPSRVLYRDSIPVPPGRDIALVIRPMPNNPNRVILDLWTKPTAPDQ